MGIARELEDVFNNSFQNHTQEALIKCLFNAYAISSHECKTKFTPEEGHDLLPFYRWVQLRMLLRGLDGRFKEIEAKIESNGSTSHIVIDSDRIMLTVSCVDRLGGFPRPAIYRNEYANECHYDLFKPLPNESKVYALLTHGVDKSDRARPAFAEIVFPAKGFASYIHRINLFKKFDSLVNSFKPATPTKHILVAKEFQTAKIKKVEGQ